MSDDSEVHISTKDKPGDYDAFETAKSGEPIFTLQGGDPFAIKPVLLWAVLARKQARKLDDEEGKEEEAAKLRDKANSAESVAWAMQAYQRGDLPVEETRANYNDEDDVVAVSADEKVARRRALIKGVSQLNNSLAIANDVAEMLLERQLHPVECGSILAAVDILKQAAAGIEPRRGMERS